MNKGDCIKCGKSVMAITLSEGVCLSCQSPEASIGRPRANNSGNTPNSSSAAILTLNSVAVIVLLLSVLSGLIIAVLGGQSGVGGTYLVGIGIVIALGGLVQWAFIKVFAGLAQDIKAIREKI